MFIFYSFLLTIALLALIPFFLLRREKYAAGLSERLGRISGFEHDGRPVIWLHAVSVGEANAARPLVEAIRERFPGHRLVISTTTRTGQELARNIFKDKAEFIFYFPFDLKISVRNAMEVIKPAVVLVMETEIWPRFFREAKMLGAEVVIVNGRLSERSLKRYSIVKGFIRKVLANVDLALMQGHRDAERIISLGMDPQKVRVTGNIKFDHDVTVAETELTEHFRSRFGFSPERKLLVAASTHGREEEWILNAFLSASNDVPRPRPRLLIAPRHPARFDAVAEVLEEFRNSEYCEWPDYRVARRSLPEDEADKRADVILLDTIGELRAVYPMADVVFVGGSLIPHGGQSILEPAAAGKAVLTGPHTENFEAVVKEFLGRRALIQIREAPEDVGIVEELYGVFLDLLANEQKRRELGDKALSVMTANRGATEKTIKELSEQLIETGKRTGASPR